MLVVDLFVFFFKQKTAYEMRISDWSSDVCSSDLRDWGLGLPRWDGAALKDGGLLLWGEQGVGDQILYGTMLRDAAARSGAQVTVAVDPRLVEIGRASCRDRVCQYV